jgi:hypothetical protein
MLPRQAYIYRFPALLILLGFMPVSAQSGNGTAHTPGSRVYFIAAEDVDWNYLPAGKKLTGVPQADEDDVEASASRRALPNGSISEFSAR